MSKCALFVMDLQRDYLGDEARLPIAKHQVDPLLRSVHSAIQYAEQQGWDVYYIRNEFKPWQLISNYFRRFATMEGHAAAGYDDRLRLSDGGKHYIKRKGSAFSNTELKQYLVRHGVEKIVLAGVFAEGCVLATARDAMKYGYEVTTLVDALGSSNDRKKQQAIMKMQTLGALTITSDTLMQSETAIREVACN